MARLGPRCLAVGLTVALLLSAATVASAQDAGTKQPETWSPAADREAIERAKQLMGWLGARVRHEAGKVTTTLGVWWPNANDGKQPNKHIVAELYKPGADEDGQPTRTVKLLPQGGGFYSGVDSKNQDLHGWGYRFRDTRGTRLVDYVGAQPVHPGDRRGSDALMQVVDTTRIQRPQPVAGGSKQLIVAEVNPQTLTEDGTLFAATKRFGELRDLGFTAVELMPTTWQFGHGPFTFEGPGGTRREGQWVRGWGYDNQSMVALNEGREVMAYVVDQAHGAGLEVYLDLVFNHVSPDFPAAAIGPLLDSDVETEWGGAFNFYNEYSLAPLMDFVRWLIEDVGVDGLRLDAVWALGPYAPVVLKAINEVAQKALDDGKIERPFRLLLEAPPPDLEAIMARVPAEQLPALELVAWGDFAHHELMMWGAQIPTADPEAMGPHLAEAAIPDFYKLRDPDDQDRAWWAGTAEAVAARMMYGVTRNIRGVKGMQAIGNHDTKGNAVFGEGMADTFGRVGLSQIEVGADLITFVIDAVGRGRARTTEQMAARMRQQHAEAVKRTRQAIVEGLGEASDDQVTALGQAVPEAAGRFAEAKKQWWAWWPSNKPNPEPEPTFGDAWAETIKRYPALQGGRFSQLDFDTAVRIGQAAAQEHTLATLTELVGHGPEAIEAWIQRVTHGERLHQAFTALVWLGFEPPLGFFPGEVGGIDAARAPFTESRTSGGGSNPDVMIGRQKEHAGSLPTADLGRRVVDQPIPGDPGVFRESVDPRPLSQERASLITVLNEARMRRGDVYGNPDAPVVSFGWGPERPQRHGNPGRDVVVLVTGAHDDPSRAQIVITNKGDDPVTISWGELKEQIEASQTYHYGSRTHGPPLTVADGAWNVTVTAGNPAPGELGDGTVVVQGRQTIAVEPASTDAAGEPPAAHHGATKNDDRSNEPELGALDPEVATALAGAKEGEQEEQRDGRPSTSADLSSDPDQEPIYGMDYWYFIRDGEIVRVDGAIPMPPLEAAAPAQQGGDVATPVEAPGGKVPAPGGQVPPGATGRSPSTPAQAATATDDDLIAAVMSGQAPIAGGQATPDDPVDLLLDAPRKPPAFSPALPALGGAMWAQSGASTRAGDLGDIGIPDIEGGGVGWPGLVDQPLDDLKGFEVGVEGESAPDVIGLDAGDQQLEPDAVNDLLVETLDGKLEPDGGVNDPWDQILERGLEPDGGTEPTLPPGLEPEPAPGAPRAPGTLPGAEPENGQPGDRCQLRILCGPGFRGHNAG